MSKIYEPNFCLESWGEKINSSELSYTTRLRRQLVCYLEDLKPQPGEQLLDIGCGEGEFLTAAVLRGLISTGLENLPTLAVLSQKTAPQAKIVLGNRLELPFDNNAFELATALDIGEYFADPVKGLHEVYRILKPGGRSFLLLANAHFSRIRQQQRWTVLPNGDSPVAYSAKIWRQLLGLSGFKIKAFYPLIITLIPSDQSVCNWKEKLLKRFSQGWGWLIPKTLVHYFVGVCYK